jgi:hypothetical protein
MRSLQSRPACANGARSKASPQAGRRSRRSRIRAMGPPRRSPKDRRTALSQVLGLWPHELDDISAVGRKHVVAKLRRVRSGGGD